MLQLHSKTEKKKVLVAKLPSEVSVPDVYLVFKEVHPSLLKESAFCASPPNTWIVRLSMVLRL